MPVFMCRWPNGDLSFVSARNREDAIIALDELDNAEAAELRVVRDFMVDFRLTDGGDLELFSLGRCPPAAIAAWRVLLPMTFGVRALVWARGDKKRPER